MAAKLSICQIKVQSVRESQSTYYVRDPSDVKIVWDNEITKSAIFEPEKEMFFVLMTNIRHRIINYNLVSMGSLDNCFVSPREVFRPAIASAAHSIILLHNHPSGDTSPSCEDISITQKLVEAGKLLGVPVLDHCIMSSLVNNIECSYDSDFNQCLSLRESGMVIF